jgi:predicted GNAT family N-acyltransferase|tara:strand:- start:4836 stop:5327 length:492 start_codon:yes stop_codon:yes gene_type:complete
MLKLECVKTKNLKINVVNKILSLKNSYWKYNVSSQRNFFKSNIKKNDFHILLSSEKKLLAYVCLRKGIFIKKNKKIKHIRFDTFIISKSSRGKNYSYLLMNFTNKIIENSNCAGILFTGIKLINLYKKFNWKVAKPKKFKILTPSANDQLSNEKIMMIYNEIV